ncbi:MAG: hypothetical protein WDN04_07880 [Rhodospirillales bacterium]
MKNLLLAGVAAMAFSVGTAVAQTTESTTSQSTTMAPDPNAPPAVPPPGTLSTTREAHAVDAYGNRTDSKASTYRNGNGVANDSTTTTTSVPAPPPPPVTTSTTTTDTTTGPH